MRRLPPEGVRRRMRDGAIVDRPVFRDAMECRSAIADVAGWLKEALELLLRWLSVCAVDGCYALDKRHVEACRGEHGSKGVCGSVEEAGGRMGLMTLTRMTMDAVGVSRDVRDEENRARDERK